MVMITLIEIGDIFFLLILIFIILVYIITDIILYFCNFKN